METVVMFIGLALAGIVIGIFSGMLGIGGGTVMVPTLRLVFGLSAYTSTATSLFTMIFTSVSGAVTHVRQKTSIPLLGLALGLGGAVTSALGVWLGSISPSWAIMLVAAIIIVYSSYTMLSKALKLPKGGKAQAEAHAAAASEGMADDGGELPTGSAHADRAAYHVTLRRFVAAVGIGMIAGLCAGYIGVGGGFIMVPMMTGLLSVPMGMASGTSLMAIIILAIPGVIEQIMYGNVDFIAGIALAVGSIPGAVIGAKLVPKIPERQLRFVFAAFLAVAAIALVVNEFGLL